MEKQSTSSIFQDTIIKEQTPEQISGLDGFLQRMGLSDTIPADYDVKDYFSNIIRGLLEVVHVQSGRVSFLLRVKPVVTVNYSLFYPVFLTVFFILRNCVTENVSQTCLCVYQLS